MKKSQEIQYVIDFFLKDLYERPAPVLLNCKKAIEYMRELKGIELKKEYNEDEGIKTSSLDFDQ